VTTCGATLAEARDRARRFYKADLDAALAARKPRAGRTGYYMAIAHLRDVERHGGVANSARPEAASVEREIQSMRAAMAMLETYRDAPAHVRAMFAASLDRCRR
jgi:hypothetical protein